MVSNMVTMFCRQEASLRKDAAFISHQIAVHNSSKVDGITVSHEAMCNLIHNLCYGLIIVHAELTQVTFASVMLIVNTQLSSGQLLASSS